MGRPELTIAALIAALAFPACTHDGPDALGPAPFAGGATTVADRTSNAYTFPAPNLGAGELDLHLDGDLEFEAVFVTPPADVNAGLGPRFNHTSCTGCHVRDGRGLPVTDGGPLNSPMLVRVSLADGEPAVPGGQVPVPGLGLQIQDHAVYGHEPEASVGVRWVEQPGAYGDGEPYTLRRPVLDIALAGGEPLPFGVQTSPRIPPPVFGLGLLEAVPEEAIRALADPDDRDGDGISGRANEVWDAVRGRTVLGRFGWKASQPDLRQQAATAYAEDMGVDPPLTPEDEASSEITPDVLAAVTFYVQTLAVPGRDRWDDRQVRRGEALFRDIGCAACHVEELRTEDHDVPALRDQRIHPYTDLLLHNMGFDLADGRPDFEASGTEWRTAPLWGIGLAHTVLPYSGFLHDGRARTLAEAVLWHGGEAEASKEAFRTLPARDREALLTFLGSL